MTLAQPAWLLLLVLLPMIGALAIVVARLRGKKWSAFIAPRLRRSLLLRGSTLPRWFALVFLLAACAALTAALARPRAEAGTRTEKTIGRNVLVALDLSRSMRVKDVKPDRLAQAKMVIYELMDAMPNERIGLIGFAGNAYLYAPLTVDHRAVRETVEQIDETWAPLGGSNLSDALRLAIETLKETGQKNNALVILSDGEKHDGDIEDMIAEAERSGVYILAIGVGTEDGDYVPSEDFPGDRMLDRNAQPVLSRLQPEVMRQLAEETKGRFAMAGSGTDIPALVKSTIKDLDSFEVAGRERRVAVEFYQWLLLPAILFLIASIVSGTRWRGLKPAAAVAGLMLLPGSARADGVADARKALESNRHDEAREAYQDLAGRSRLPERKARFHLGEATAAYRGGDFKDARSAYSRAMLSDDPAVAANSHLGMGNTLFQLGWRLLAGESYPTDPEKLPDMEYFDTKFGELLSKPLEDDEESDGENDTQAASGYTRIKSIITNWSDAVRHYDSALAAQRDHPQARHNRDMTMDYLKRLQELLEEEEQATEESMPQPQPGEGEPQQGEGQPQEEPGDEQGKGDEPKPEGDSGRDGEEKNQDSSGADDDKDSSGEKPREKPENQDEKDGKGKEPQDPDETPEERARRLLEENADLERGPLTPGRREFMSPEKDW